MVFAVSVAVASDPSPTTLLPSAASAAQGSAEVGLSLGHGTLGVIGTETVVGGAAVRAGWAPSEAVWLELGVGGAGGPATSCGIMPGGSCSDSVWSGGGVALSGRYRVAVSPGFAIAPFVGGFAGASSYSAGGGGAAGLALEGGGRRVRGDLSLALAGGVADGTFDLFPIGEGGVSFLIGSERRHALRVGVVEVAPELSWRYEADRWFAGAGLTGIPFVAGAERIVVGLRF